ncbi:MAG: hypothetical protein GXO78_05400 [Calditrichaeota bacterium]|nr:hypothetical protein [Calditrichota bacterium]
MAVDKHRMVEALLPILQGDDRHPIRWLHLWGEPGMGKTHILNRVLPTMVSEEWQLLRWNATLFQKNYPWSFIRLMRWLSRLYPDNLQRFVQHLPGGYRRWMGAFLQQLEKQPENILETIGELPQVVFWVLSGILRQGKWLILLDDMESTGYVSLDFWERFFHLLQMLPLRIVTAGCEETIAIAGRKPDHILSIPRLSLKESEVLLGQIHPTHPINLRLINNSIYLKSRGNPRQLLYLFEAYFRPLCHSDPDALLDPEQLRALRISADPQEIFSRILEQQSEADVRVLSLLARLRDPLPENVCKKIFSKEEFQAIETLVRRGLVQKENQLGQTVYGLRDASWKGFLRQHTEVPCLSEVLSHLTGEQVLEDGMVQRSHLFLEAEAAEQAVLQAYREARHFQALGQSERALDRYAFVRRNRQYLPAETHPGYRVLQEMGQLQKQLGLYDNAFDTLREARELAPRDDPQLYFRITLEMAATLLKMDAYSEARYLIREVKFQKIADAETRIWATLLLGDLEYYLGHRAYALRHYQTALEMMEQGSGTNMAESLYVRLRGMRRELSPQQWLSFLSRLKQVTPVNSPLLATLLYEEARSYLGQYDYLRALPIVQKVCRRGRSGLHPIFRARVQQTLADIYAYFGKWHLAASHLRQLVESGLLEQHPEWLVQAWIQRAIVYKEMGQYGRAFRALETAAQMARRFRQLRAEYEIRMHQGHIQLLVHNPMAAHSELQAVHHWAENQHDLELMVPVQLFLSMYEMQQQRFDRASGYLEQVSALLDEDSDVFDRLNYLYYATVCALQQAKVSEARQYLDTFRQLGEAIPKYAILSRYLTGWMLRLDNKSQEAKVQLTHAVEEAQRRDMPHLALQIYRELLLLDRDVVGHRERREWIKAARAVYQELLRRMDDPILQRQLEESSELEFFQRQFSRGMKMR